MDEYYRWSQEGERFPPEKEAAFEILQDLDDRGGFGGFWDNFDDDLKAEILEGWAEKIKAKMVPTA